MDLEPEELQFLSIAGIFSESLTLILNPTLRPLFSQITLTLILPLSLLFLIHILISHILVSQIAINQQYLDLTLPNSPSNSRLNALLASEWTAFLLFKSVYLIFLLIFSLLSTAAVVYTIASAFTGKPLSFSKVFSVVPKVWKRLMGTFLWAFLVLVCYNVAAFVLIVLFIVMFGDVPLFGDVVFLMMCLAYLGGLVWVSVVWHLASVVSVLEDAGGLNAMRKSAALIKGKTWVAVLIFLILNLGFGGIEFAFRRLVVLGDGVGMGGRVVYGLVAAGLLMVITLLGLVVQTVVYFVCKSYHHESIDKSSLSDHLEVYLGDYVPLKEKDVQMNQFSLA